MKERTSLVLFYTPNNTFSFNVLIGALEADPGFDGLEIHFEPRKPGLIRKLRSLENDRGRTVVAFSFATPQFFKIRETVFHLKHAFPRMVFVAGGPHPSGLPEHTLGLGFDHVVVGEGEAAFPALMKAVMKGKDPAEEKIPGLASSDGKGGCAVQLPGPPVRLDDYPPFAEKHGLFNPIEITRGCPHGCGFCQTSRLLGRTVRHRSAATVAARAEVLLRHGQKDIRFISSDGFGYGSPDGREAGAGEMGRLLGSVDRALNGRGRIFFGAFPSEARPEHVTAEKLDLVRRYAANTNLIIGGQTGSDRLLKLCGRGHTVADIARACELTVRAGLDANIDLIFGLPGENDDDRRETLGLIRSLSGTGVRFHGHAFLPLAGTGLWGKKPEFPEGRYLEELDSLTEKKALWGSWKMQAALSRKIYSYFQEPGERPDGGVV